jgi:hypothetical protein
LLLVPATDAVTLPPELWARLEPAFARGVGHGLLELGLREVGTALPADFAYWRDFAARYVTVLCTSFRCEDCSQAVDPAKAGVADSQSQGGDRQARPRRAQADGEAPMKPDARLVQLTQREVELLLRYGYPFEAEAARLRACKLRDEIRIGAFWLSQWIGDSYSARNVRGARLREELDALCCVLESAERGGRTARGAHGEE